MTDAVATNYNSSTIQKVYDRWAPIYDRSFGTITAAGRRAAVAAANAVGGRILECGVGTGMSLPDYGPQCSVTGIDLSYDMLARARKRADDGLTSVNGIVQMDATHLAFEDQRFDCVVAMYLITVVPEPERVMAELTRVTRPGGEVILVNHFSTDVGLRSWIEKIAAPFAHRLGWRPEFPFERVLGQDKLKLIEKRPAGMGGLFTLVRFSRLL